jgi:hypothetical protein
MKAETISRRARVASRDGISRFRTVSACLIDITERGVHLVSEAPAEEGQVVWFGLEALPWEWVRATVAKVVSGGGVWNYHVAFGEPCPVGILEAAVDNEWPYPSEIPLTFSFELD